MREWRNAVCGGVPQAAFFWYNRKFNEPEKTLVLDSALSVGEKKEYSKKTLDRIGYLAYYIK